MKKRTKCKTCGARVPSNRRSYCSGPCGSYRARKAKKLEDFSKLEAKLFPDRDMKRQKKRAEEIQSDPELKKLYAEAREHKEKTVRRAEQAVCAECGGLFQRGRNYKQRKYCSGKCRNIAGKKRGSGKLRVNDGVVWRLCLRQRGLCYQCGQTLPDVLRRVHIHHLNALIQDGGNQDLNIVLTCDRCHPRGLATPENLGSLRVLSPAYTKEGLPPWSHTDDG